MGGLTIRMAKSSIFIAIIAIIIIIIITIMILIIIIMILIIIIIIIIIILIIIIIIIIIAIIIAIAIIMAVLCLWGLREARTKVNSPLSRLWARHLRAAADARLSRVAYQILIPGVRREVVVEEEEEEEEEVQCLLSQKSDLYSKRT